MDVDGFFQKYGEFGSYQKELFWVINFINPIQAFHNIHNVFMAATPHFTCVNANQSPQPGCPEDGAKQTCDKYLFSGDDFTSIVSEWGLVCDQSHLASLVQSIYMIGYLLGNVLFGWLADNYGRRPVICWTVALVGVFTIFGSLSQSYRMYVLMRGIVGVCSAGFGLASFTYLTEIVGASKRSFVGAIMPAGFAVGICILSVLAYFIRHWRYLSIVTMLPCLISVYWFMVLPESPRWLLSQGRVQEAERVLESFLPKTAFSEPIKMRDPTKTSSSSSSSSSNSSKGHILDLVRSPVLRWITLNNFISWFVNCAVYYGITMNAGNLGSNIYISTALSGLIELPSFVVMTYIMDRLGRRPSYSWNMVLSGISCLAILLLPADYENARIVLALCGKFGICISFSLAYVYVAELYPTNVRNKAIGVINISARAGGIVSPMIIALGMVHHNLDFLIFGAMGIFGGLISLRLPETLNRPMAETISDLTIQGQGTTLRSNKVKKIISADKVKLIQGEIAATEKRYKEDQTV